MNTETPFNIIGGRKLIITVICILALVATAHLNPAAMTVEFVTALLGLAGAFNASNVINTISSLKKSKRDDDSDSGGGLTAQFETQLNTPLTTQPKPVYPDNVEVRLNLITDVLNKHESSLNLCTEILTRLTSGPTDANKKGVENEYTTNDSQVKAQASKNRSAIKDAFPSTDFNADMF